MRSAASLTVILPVRNGAGTIGAAVRSTLQAMPEGAVLLVHDDASSDGTATILADETDPRLRVLRSDSPLGVARGLNHLLEHVNTAFVARMDADDVCLPWRFHLQGRAIARGADVVFSTVVGIRAGRLRPSPPIGISAESMPLHLLVSNPVAHSTMAARTEVVRRAGGYRSVPAEDYELWLRLASLGVSMRRVAAPCLLYRFHDRQLTASKEWNDAASADPVLDATYRALAEEALGVGQDEVAPLWRLAASPHLADSPRAEDMARRLRDRAGSLNAVQRILLHRKLRALGL
jgi:glycosyltransferase involved in cell wall biosynthesis